MTDATKQTSTMSFRTFFGGSGFKQNVFSKFCLSGLILLGGANAMVQARGILAGADISGYSLGRGNYAYTLTLTNAPASTSDIGMFWFGWESGQADFLSSEPTSIQTPAGWNATVEGGGAGDGYSVQFITFTTPLAPGSSVTFTFDSTDSPRIMSEEAELFPGYPTLTSQVYSGHAADGLQEVFVAQLVQPTSLGMVVPRRSGPNLVLTWGSATNAVLQESSTLPSTNWTTVAGTLGKGTFTVTNFSTNAATYYRLATQ
jgi:hypothetical protein